MPGVERLHFGRRKGLKMLSGNAANIIQALAFDAHAETIHCLLPLGSIFWSDELPSLRFLAFNDAADRNAVMRLFAIRINYWNTGEMRPEDKSFWDAAQKQFPNWALFRRMHLTEAERLKHEKVQKQAEDFFDVIISASDEVTLSENENGVTSFSATINIGDE